MDKNAHKVDRALKRAARRLNLHIKGDTKYGWNRKSAGSKVIDDSGETKWLRVQYRDTGNDRNKLWNGIKKSKNIKGVKKPKFIDETIWKGKNGNFVWRGDVMSYVAENVCSDTPALDHNPNIDENWLHDLKSSMESLMEFDTCRGGASQDFVTRRIRKYVSKKVDTKVDHWTTVHGDMHWANLTTPELWILDWEGWGQGPFGFDAAVLWAYSLKRPDVADRIYNYFRELLDTPDGIRSRLFIGGMIIRMTEDYGDHPDLTEKVSDEMKDLVYEAPKA